MGTQIAGNRSPGAAFERFGTAADWTAENPVLAAGEIGAIVEAGTITGLIVGDGVRTYTQITAAGLRIPGPLRVDGPIDAPNSAATNSYPFPAPACQLLGTATFPTTPTNGFSGALLADGTDGGVTFSRSFPADWTTANLSWGYIPIVGTGTLNVRWRVTVRRANVFGDTGAATQDQFIYSVAAGTAGTMGHVFNNNGNAAFNMHNVGAFFGEVTSISVERVGSDGVNDTYTGGILVTNLNVTKTT